MSRPLPTPVPFSLDAVASFVALADELHFTRAAKRLNVAQPALTKRIQQLEEVLGVQLFHRTRRAVELTPDGRSLLDAARHVINGAGELAAFAARLRGGEAGRLRLAFTPSAPHHVLPALMRDFRRRHPDVACILREAGSEEQVRLLLSGEVDVGILRPPAPCPVDLVCRTFLEEPYLAVLPRDHALASRHTVSLASLADQPFVMISRQVVATIYNQIIDACAAAGFAPRIVQEATHIHAVVGLVAAGCGVTLLPASAATLGVREAVCRPLRPATLTTVMALAHRIHPRPVVAPLLRSAGRAFPQK